MRPIYRNLEKQCFFVCFPFVNLLFLTLLFYLVQLLCSVSLFKLFFWTFLVFPILCNLSLRSFSVPPSLRLLLVFHNCLASCSFLTSHLLFFFIIIFFHSPAYFCFWKKKCRGFYEILHVCAGNRRSVHPYFPFLLHHTLALTRSSHWSLWASQLSWSSVSGCSWLQDLCWSWMAAPWSLGTHNRRFHPFFFSFSSTGCLFHWPVENILLNRSRLEWQFIGINIFALQGRAWTDIECCMFPSLPSLKHWMQNEKG